MSYSTGVVPTLAGERVYPTPLFESALSLVIVFALSYIERSENILARRFQRFGFYLVLISLERVVVEFLRINPPVLWGFSEAQVIGASLSLLGLLFILVPRRAVAAPPVS
jgi:prolipoprotein diacylglyceryltransferase